MNSIELADEIESKYNNLLNLTANENVLSPAAERLQKSSVYNRYLMGNDKSEIFAIGNFAQVGMPEAQTIIQVAIDSAKKMLHAEFIDMNCISGIHAMMCSILASTMPGDVILTIPGSEGGHFATKGLLDRTGRSQMFIPYINGCIDFEGLHKIAKNNHVKAVYLDAAVQLFKHPIKEIRKAIGPDTLIIYDASHTMGLIMSECLQSPLLEGADIISANTHKTLPGPHHGMIAFKNREIGEQISSQMQNSFYSSNHTNEVLALAVTILEMDKWGKEYSRNIVQNANALGRILELKGHSVRKIHSNEYTNTHQIHLYVESTSREVVKRFFDSGISLTTSRAMGGGLFARIGLQEITRRGANQEDMKTIANLIDGVLCSKNMLNETQEFIQSFNTVKYGYGVLDQLPL